MLVETQAYPFGARPIFRVELLNFRGVQPMILNQTHETETTLIIDTPKHQPFGSIYKFLHGLRSKHPSFSSNSPWKSKNYVFPYGGKE